MCSSILLELPSAPIKGRKPTAEDFEGIKLEDLVVEKREVTIKGSKMICNMTVEIRGFPTDKISMSILRKLWSLFKVSGYKNATKTQTLALMAQHKINTPFVSLTDPL
jgi:hypothetical protein